MRACMLFVTGLLVGVGLHIGRGPEPERVRTRDSSGVNHIGMNVPNLDEAVAFYTKTLGFPEAFRVNDDKGQARLVYVQISKNTFFEIQPGPDVPPRSTTSASMSRTWPPQPRCSSSAARTSARSRTSDTKAILNNITDPNGIRIELAELPPAVDASPGHEIGGE